MKEEFLQYIWQFQLLNQDLKDTNGESIEIISPGTINADAGPDFFNAKIKIDHTIWAGNIEIHVNTSDWENHNHHNDDAYKNVILHLVYNHDIDYFPGDIPVCEMNFNENIYLTYEILKESNLKIPCAEYFTGVDDFTFNSWLEVLLIERLQEKVMPFNELYERIHSWEEVLYIKLSGAMGLKVNVTPFEMVARKTPLKILAKHKDKLIQLEALLFGQAGFLQNDKIEDVYYNNLKREYSLLKSKYELRSIDKYLWKFLRLRPSNFPTLRIAQLAALIHKSTGLFSKLLKATSFEQIESLLSVEASAYWKTHYNFQKQSDSRVKSLGKDYMRLLSINVIVPILFAYGEAKQEQKYKDKAIDLLHQIKAESNTIIKDWEKLGIKTQNASQTQALLQLRNKYCNHRKCLNCRIGNLILKQNSI